MLIEQIVLEYLAQALGDIPVYMEIPSEHPETFVVITKSASGRSDLIDFITLEFRSYAPSKYESAVLDDEVKKALLGDGMTNYGIVELDQVASCKYGGGNDAPDTTEKRYRYRSYYNFSF